MLYQKIRRFWINIFPSRGKSVVLLSLAMLVLSAGCEENTDEETEEDKTEQKIYGESVKLAEGYREIYETAAEQGNLHTLEVQQKILDSIGSSGYAAVDRDDQINMVNYEQVEDFCKSAGEEEEDSVTIISLTKEGDFVRYDMETENGTIDVIVSTLRWEERNIMYSYKSKRDTLVLKQVSAAFEEGTFYAIIGPSGSGKTTFLSLLAGLDSPVSGNILYNGEDIRKKGLNYHRRHDISLVFQNYNLIDYLTTEENVKLGGKKDAEKLLQEVSIPSEDWKRNVLQLSGGQQQRVAIARALASESKVLLADEPTGNLDEDTSSGIIELLKRTAHESGKCVIVVTHSRQLAEEADEVLEIKAGKLKVRDI